VISEEAGRAMSVISGIDFCKSVEQTFWLNCVNRIVLDLDEAGHQDRIREIRAMLYQIWQVLPDKPRVTRCNRCEMLPGTFPVRAICGDCDDVLLCQSCYEFHAREVFDEGRESDTALTGAALLRFEAAAEVVVRVAERDMTLKNPLWKEGDVIASWGDRPLSASEAENLNRREAPNLADFGHGVDLAGPADSRPRGASRHRLHGDDARAESGPGVASPGGGDPPPAAGEGTEGAEG
jgi:hypothetical protein